MHINICSRYTVCVRSLCVGYVHACKSICILCGERELHREKKLYLHTHIYGLFCKIHVTDNGGNDNDDEFLHNKRNVD